MPVSSAALDRVGASVGLGVAACLLLAPAAAAPAVLLGSTALAVGWIVWRDAATFTIPDGAVIALGLVGAAARVAGDGATVDAALALGLDVALTGGVLWLLREGFYRWRGHDGIGFGDVKLAAAAGLLVGAAGFAVALLAASLAGIVIALLRGVGRTERIAFGVLLAPAVWLILATDIFAPHLLVTSGVSG